MLTAPFYGEVPHDLGCDAAWLGRDVMLALLQEPRPALRSRAGPPHTRCALPRTPGSCVMSRSHQGAGHLHDQCGSDRCLGCGHGA